ncbi:MAG: 1-acyl-sn-glycerol-3-phosphate acyltransferase [Bacteroidales bacterium]|nr:1-acyl-sn-glycerol-3-phosphate acyltransferase [Bacteroidales bacterium]
MAKFWEKDKGYNRLHGYANIVTRSCFRGIKVEGLENLPKDGAVLLAPNHVAAMMDPMLVLLLRKGREGAVGFGARSDIFAKPKVGRFLRWLRIMPIARERNGLSEVTKNYDTFDEIVECIGHGTPFCLYAEGTHRPERGMLPVKKGIFRVARLACEKLDKPVYVVPMGLDYEYFFRAQGRAAVRVGEPIDIRAEFACREEAGMPEGDIYRELCQKLREADLAMIGRTPERNHGNRLLRTLLALLGLPLFVLCAAGSILIWLPHAIIMSTMQDKAWYHTVYFALHFLFPILWPFSIGFGRLLNFYRNLIEDFKK